MPPPEELELELELAPPIPPIPLALLELVLVLVVLDPPAPSSPPTPPVTEPWAQPMSRLPAIVSTHQFLRILLTSFLQRRIVAHFGEAFDSSANAGLRKANEAQVYANFVAIRDPAYLVCRAALQKAS